MEQNGTPATKVDTDAACTIDKVGEGFKITTMQLTVHAVVPGVEDAAFQKIAAATKLGCPVSQALTGVEITLSATLN